MAGLYGPHIMAPVGSTGNNTHASVNVHPSPDKLAAVLVVEAVGATPTITVKVQGTMDSATDGSANWFDLAVQEPGSDTATATPSAKTAVGSYPLYLSNAHLKFVRRVRIVTSANTNVTYRGELYQHITEK